MHALLILHAAGYRWEVVDSLAALRLAVPGRSAAYTARSRVTPLGVRESITARDQSSFFAARSFLSSTTCSSSHHAARLLQAQQDGTDEDDLRQIAAEALGEVYFRDNGRRAQSLEVKLTDLVDLKFEL
ncbi:hypothetical protein SAV14893_093070 [Streptomyces avermitilis]|uniref:Terminal protein Tpg homolog n=2 Tax=Streptomyces avermitilis TaxID=33903 RepID=Q82R67_STRAW|nr:putative terminal protein Tpg homolog [Streptomyces avermitilis MA-4680 = NBRC 14893]BBJ47707.1 hypothetical protein SAVMC3_03360 [Streptomyces avermitilis]GDY69914.1 hypothetical protein SAV14893_093070 [Streptomyces avermitilis]GDY80179.1 hypothetical protein SAV31267_096640 [Streptomyces avermitilis]